MYYIYLYVQDTELILFLKKSFNLVSKQSMVNTGIHQLSVTEHYKQL